MYSVDVRRNLEHRTLYAEVADTCCAEYNFFSEPSLAAVSALPFLQRCISHRT